MSDKELILFALVTSLKITAVHIAFWEGMILSWLKSFLPQREWFAKPLYDCLPCMALLYGAILWFIKFQLGFFDNGRWWEFILIVCAVNAVIEAIIQFLRYAVIERPQ